LEKKVSAEGVVDQFVESIQQALEPLLTAGTGRRKRNGFADVNFDPGGDAETEPAAGGLPTTPPVAEAGRGAICPSLLPSPRHSSGSAISNPVGACVTAFKIWISKT